MPVEKEGEDCLVFWVLGCAVGLATRHHAHGGRSQCLLHALETALHHGEIERRCDEGEGLDVFGDTLNNIRAPEHLPRSGRACAPFHNQERCEWPLLLLQNSQRSIGRGRRGGKTLLCLMDPKRRRGSLFGECLSTLIGFLFFWDGALLDMGVIRIIST